MKEGYITMCTKEVDRLETIRKVIDKRLKQKDAATILGVTVWQVKRLVNKYKKYGPAGLVSKHRNKPSNNRHSQKFKDEVISIIQKYQRGQVFFRDMTSHQKRLDPELCSIVVF
jgi:transposase